MKGAAGALAWRAAKVWAAVRALVTALVAGARGLEAVPADGAGEAASAADLLAVGGPVLVFVVAAVVVVTLARVHRSGEGVMLADLGLGLRHVAAVVAATAVTLEAAVHTAVG